MFKVPPAALTAVLALAACTPAQDSASPAPQPSVMDDSTASQSPDSSATGTDAEGPRPMMAHSAWRVTGQDGATYATFLDPSGRYRDTKNGKPRQQGAWNVREDGAVCFLPDGDNVRGDCWNLGRLHKDGTVVATDQDDLRIELSQIDYQAPDGE